MTKAEIRDKAVAFATANGLDKAKWTQEAHCAFLMKVLCEIAGVTEREKKLAVLEVLGQHGLGANASQFRQWLWKTEGEAGPTADILEKWKD